MEDEVSESRRHERLAQLSSQITAIKERLVQLEGTGVELSRAELQAFRQRHADLEGRLAAVKQPSGGAWGEIVAQLEVDYVGLIRSLQSWIERQDMRSLL